MRISSGRMQETGAVLLAGGQNHENTKEVSMPKGSKMQPIGTKAGYLKACFDGQLLLPCKEVVGLSISVTPARSFYAHLWEAGHISNLEMRRSDIEDVG